MAKTARQYRWDDMPKEKLNDLLDRRLVTGERMMLAHVYLKKGCLVPRHSHENEQITYVLSGALHFWLGEDEKEERLIKAGEVGRCDALLRVEAKTTLDGLAPRCEFV